MTARTFRVLSLVITCFLSGIMVWAITYDLSLVIPLIAIAVTVLIKVFAYKKMNERIVDERVVSIGNRASRITYQVIIYMMAIASFIIILLKDTVSYEFQIVGTTFAYIACAMLLVYISCYYIISARS